MLILALDTATSAVTVALHDGERTLAESSVLGSRGHGEQLAPAIERVLADAGRGVAELTELVGGVGISGIDVHDEPIALAGADAINE